MRAYQCLLACLLVLSTIGGGFARAETPFYGDTPLAFLERLKHYDNRLHSFIIDGKVKDWVTEADIPALLEMLDSTDECAGVMSGASGRIPGRSTIGDEAAFLIDGFRTRFYPPRLHSKRYTEAEKQDLRNWWILYNQAAEAPRR